MYSLAEWIEKNFPDKTKLWQGAAGHQLYWVRGAMSDLGLKPIVDGTHNSKSIVLPVYSVKKNGIITKFRGNFHNWAVSTTAIDFEPKRADKHAPFAPSPYFEGMVPAKYPNNFIVWSKEDLYLNLFLMLEK